MQKADGAVSVPFTPASFFHTVADRSRAALHVVSMDVRSRQSSRSSSAVGATENSFGPLVLGDRARLRTSKIRSNLLTLASALFRMMGNPRRTRRHLWA